jgi:hypoxanthine phosphoribosyltransferase
MSPIWHNDFLLLNEVEMHKDIAEMLISEEEIHAKVVDLGKQITRDYRDKSLLLLGVLKGAVPFIIDLARAIDLLVDIDYMAISSYGNETHSSGVVRILKDLEAPIDQKHVLIVEDIVDSGLTLNYLYGMLKKRDPLSIRVCTLLNKVQERNVEVELAYEGFSIPMLFVVGYGMDYAQLYRNLPYIGILKPEAYEDNTEKPQTHHKHPLEGKETI